MGDEKRTVDAGGSSVGPPVAAKLVVVAGRDEGREVALDGDVEVGSDPACDLVLSDPSVSRRHASFSSAGGRILVKDLGSRNGTFLGGTRLAQAEVPLGAVLSIGNSALALQPRWHVREVAPSSERRFGAVLGESLAMREVFAILERVAATGVSVLVEGESGTGKELVARSIHQASPRATGPYVVFDCGSVPRELAESELFGNKVGGSFRGAVAGVFAQADGGTICLDEIGELDLELQPKLLRVLETGEVRAIGDDEVRKVDVRVIAVTNRDLHAETRRGRFRPDLFYRLAVVKLRLPPLRHRPEDIPMLVRHLLGERLPPDDEISGDTLQRLVAYSWPGNVRELRNTLQRAIALARPGARFAELVFNLGPAPSAPVTIGMDFPGVAAALPYKEAKAQLLDSFDRTYVGALLKRHRGNVTQAAASAGLSRKHLYDLIKKTTGEDDADEE